MIARIAPNVRIVDLVHGLRGVASGAAVLSQSLPFAPSGVHLAIVDPGVGTDRRAVVIATADGSLLVGPDNGLLTPAADTLGGVVGACELSNPDYQLRPVSATFHGRDVFAPAAAYLALGVDPSSFGASVDVDDLVRLPPPFVSVGHGELVSDVVHVDWYGNLGLAATGADLARTALSGRVVIGSVEATVGTTFADVPVGELVVYVDSGDRVAIACNGGRASDALHDPGRVTVTRKS